MHNLFRPFVFAAICFIAAIAPAQETTPRKIGASSVWQMPAQFVTKAKSSCAGTHSSQCIINRMTKAGAPADAVSFTRELYKQSHGELGVMTGFQSVGPVDFAWITYPLRANTNYGLLMVNGDPRIVNVENLKLLDKKTMEQSFQFKDLKGRFPKVDVWPGDRDGKTWPNAQAGPDGGMQFLVGYPLINGCHACAHAGTAMFNWNFDPKGKFLGTSFIGMTPAPLK